MKIFKFTGLKESPNSPEKLIDDFSRNPDWEDADWDVDDADDWAEEVGLENSYEFIHLKVGDEMTISSPPDKWPPSKYMLTRFKTVKGGIDGFCLYPCEFEEVIREFDKEIKNYL